MMAGETAHSKHYRSYADRPHKTVSRDRSAVLTLPLRSIPKRQSARRLSRGSPTSGDDDMRDEVEH